MHSAPYKRMAAKISVNTVQKRTIAHCIIKPSISMNQR